MQNYKFTKLSVCLCLFFPILMLFLNLFWFIQAKNSLHWPVVTGEVISKKCEMTPAWRSISYEPQILYKYQVGGKLYFNNRLVISYLDRQGFDCDKMNKEIRDKVLVYYNPQSPKVAVIWPGIRFEHYTMFFIWGAILFFEIFLLRVNVVQKNKSLEAMKNRQKG